MSDRLDKLEAQLRRWSPDLPLCEAMPDHQRYESGHLRAVPGCGGDRCTSVFEEWSNQAIGFQRVLEAGHLDEYLGTRYGEHTR